MNEYLIEEFNYKNTEHVNSIINIHSQVLPDSFVVKMGYLFMRNFYYKVLPQKGNLICFLFLYNGDTAGIIVTDKKPYSLIRSSAKGQYLKLILILIRSILANPKRLATLIDIIFYKPDPMLKKFEESNNACEILTIGVLKKYRNVKINEMKISHHLLKRVCDHYSNAKFKTITGQILNSNIAAQKFYSAFGATFFQSSTSKDRIIMDLPLTNELKKLLSVIEKKQN